MHHKKIHAYQYQRKTEKKSDISIKKISNFLI